MNIAEEIGLASLKDNIFNSLTDLFLKKHISETDALLLKYSFSQKPTQEEFENLLQRINKEPQRERKLLMVSYLQKLNSELDYKNFETIEFKNILRTYRLRNIKKISHFKKICGKLQEANIPFMILKGGAFKFMRQELPRTMEDIDIVIKNEQDIVPVAKISKELGYEFYEPNIVESHSIDLHEKGSEEGILDVHKYMDIDSGKIAKKLNKGMFKRATLKDVFGVQTYFPCEEDMMFLMLVNLSKNLRYKTSIAGILFNTFDSKFLLENKPDFDWNIVVENAKITNTENQLYFAINFVNKLAPNLLPDNLLKVSTKELEAYSKLVLFDSFLYPAIHKKAREMDIKDNLSLSKFAEYITFKTKYLLFKRINNNHSLILKFYNLLQNI